MTNKYEIRRYTNFPHRWVHDSVAEVITSNLQDALDRSMLLNRENKGGQGFYVYVVGKGVMKFTPLQIKRLWDLYELTPETNIWGEKII